MDEVQRVLAARGLEPIDAILLTRLLLGAGPDDLGRAKWIVLDSDSRRREREIHREFTESVYQALEALAEGTRRPGRRETGLSTGCA
ncbi:hypothetical protein ACIBSV_18640 [Embleya sp. NPDC050154]|uniref:hypothetical protein n=1 Tax=unclassified Embleya TaxID=2699296 RepID=UPI0037BA4C7A